ncbi:MAG: YhbY family RNA-binding protein [Nanoarchaeota archaeon]|nr:YhbY family RNA-binding protein [Nanoarchaeota archaeon]
MEKQAIKELRQKAKLIDPIIRIGKNGFSESTIIQIKQLLKKRKLIKIKFLKSFLEDNDKKKAAEELCSKTGAELIDKIGFIVVIYRR